MTMKTAKWFKDGFILVTIAGDGGRSSYQHPRVSVCKLYGETKPEDRFGNDQRLPSKAHFGNATRNAETLLAFEFQQNRHNGDQADSEPWLQIDSAPTSVAYAGKLATEIRVESWGVQTETISKRLGDVDKALKAYREKVRELGSTQTACDATALMLALRTAFKLPVLLVVYRPGGLVNAYVNPEITMPTVSWIKGDDESNTTELERH